MDNNFPSTIDYRLTGCCNMCCRYCFGTTKTPTVQLSSLIKFFEFAYEKGASNIVFTGGEPTIHSDFMTLASILENIGYNLVLSSNGTFWNNKALKDYILTHFSCISFPFDSTNPNVHNYMRCASFNHHELISMIFNELHSVSKEGYPLIKIGTVVNNLNISEMGCMLDRLMLTPDIWKLYQLSSSSKNSLFYNANKISDEAFSECVCNVRQKYRHLPVQISSSYEYERDGKYLFLEPDGSLMTMKNNTENILGHIDDSVDFLYSNIVANIDTTKLNQNFVDSFARGCL